MNSGRLAGRAIARNLISRRNYGGHGHANHRTATMNDLPVPVGDFFAHNARIQSRHNAVLAVGIVMITSTLYLTYQSKLIHLNYSPPDTYE